MVWTGLLAGFIAGILTLKVPAWFKRLGIPLNGGTGLFIGCVFGAVISVYLCIALSKKSVWGSLGLIFASTVAYMVAWNATILSGMALGFAQAAPNPEGSSLGSTSIFAFAIGGAVGAFLVLLAALIFFSDRRKLSHIFLTSLKWSTFGGVLGALGWAAGPLFGKLLLGAADNRALLPSAKEDSGYYISIYLVWQAGMGLALGLIFAAECADVGIVSGATLRDDAQRPRTVRVAGIFLFLLTALVIGSFAVRTFPDENQNVKWHRAYNQHVADTPSLDNLPDVQLLPPEQVLILSRFGDYVPGPTHAGKTDPAAIVNPLVAKVPSASYGVRYGLPGAPTSGANIGPHVDVRVQQYPNAAWAKWEITEQGFDVGLANPARPVKFGYRLFGQAKLALNGQDGWYIWESEASLILVQFFSADPDEILKAYLERFPASPVDRL